MAEQKYNSSELETAHDLSTADNSVPNEAVAKYRGPDVVGQSMVRGVLFGVAGWFAGNVIGGLGARAKSHPRYRSHPAKTVGSLLAFVGAVMGAYGGAKDARFFRKQVDDLQTVVKGQHGRIDDLQTELKAQVRARISNEKAEPKSKPEAEATEKEKPDTTVDSEDLEHDRQDNRSPEIA